MEYLPSAFSRLALELRAIGADPELSLEPHPQSAPYPDAILHIAVGDVRSTFVVESRSRAPYRFELERLDQRRREWAALGTPLLLAPEIGPSVGEVLIDAGWSWADDRGNYDLRAPGLCLRRVGCTREDDEQAKLPRSPAGQRLIRWLISAFDEGHPITITQLADIIGISQAAGSKLVKRLRTLGFVDASRGLAGVDREGLLHRFAQEYTGPGGHVQRGYSLDAPNDVAERVIERHGGDVAISADVGPDHLAPWRAPTALIVYSRHPLELSELGIVPAVSSDDANVFVRYPDDPSVFADAAHPRLDVPWLADPTQMYIDLLQLGGDDRREAAGRLEAWLLK